MTKTDLIELSVSEHLEQWLFNVELECCGASLSAIEEIAIGGAVLKMADLLKVLQYAEQMEMQLRHHPTSTPPARN